MDTTEKVCPICGAPTYLVYGHPRKDGLCYKHGNMANFKQIEQCPDCGKWHETNKPCECKKPKKIEKVTETNSDNESTCIVCGEPSKGKLQCHNCYSETKNHMNSLDKNSSVRKLRDYYYNLKERIFIIKGIEETKVQCNKLIAIAITEKDINDDSSLMDRVYKDVKSLIESKKPTEVNDKYAEERKEKDESKSRINTTQDGHNVDSDMEVIIDDILYNACILHCYGKSIDEITEKRKKCDWFIPICNGKGIYIEYWGMDTEKYLKDRKEKEELYKKYDIPYISIEKDDPKKDTLTFRSNLLRELKILAERKYGFMPEWKK